MGTTSSLQVNEAIDTIDTIDLGVAWSNFIESGVLPRKNIRPVIAQSWLRSKKIDPHISKDALKPNVFKRICQLHADIIDIAVPIMKDICTISGENIVLLTDEKGILLQKVSNIDYDVPLGSKCGEQDIGTNAIGTALVEGRSIEIRRFEHYSKRLHSLSCAAMLIHGADGQVVGVIDVTTPRGELRPGTMQIIDLGVRVIEHHLKGLSEQAKYQSVDRAWATLRDFIQECVLVLDTSGRLLDANTKSLTLMGIKNIDSLYGLTIQSAVVDGNKLLKAFLMSNTNCLGHKFCLKANKNSIPCKLIRKEDFLSTNNSHIIVILFQAEKNIARTTKNTQKNGLYSFDDILGAAPNWLRIIMTARKAARVPVNVLIEGDSGTGKELISQAIHCESNREGPFVPINCGAIPRELIESELFGYEEGSFTGSRKGGHIGKFEDADKGTIFLDEIGEMPLEMQVRLLRFLQDKMVVRVGGNQARQVDVRVIAATNRNLRQEIQEGRFREDLYYRLNVVTLSLPALKDRMSDIPLLANYFVGFYCQQFQHEGLTIAQDTMNVLTHYDWPGNVRELSNVMENAVVFTEGPVIQPGILPEYISDYIPGPLRKSMDIKNYEIALIRQTLKFYQGNVSRTAKALGMARNTLYRKLNQAEK